MSHKHDFIIVGAGCGGVGVAIELRKQGIEDFVILEQADGVGGTWRDNTYPGLEVDVPSFTYCYKYEQKPDWSQLYAPGAEIKAYTEHCADKYELWPRMRFGCKVEEAVFDPGSATWQVRLAGGEVVVATYLVSACGYLSGPRLPEIDGIDDFAGKVMHTARWDHDYDLTGKRVAIIGTGATAIQVAPAIADQVERLDIYQRNAIWLSPKFNPVFSDRTKQVLRRLTFLLKIGRIATFLGSELALTATYSKYQSWKWPNRAIQKLLIKTMRKRVHDPATQEKLIPTYPFFCKRPSFSNSYYPLFNRDDIELVTDPISHLDKTGIVTSDGVSRGVDVVLCATGFRVFDRTSAPMFEIVGEGGKNLGDWWDENRYQAYLGTSVPDFPNFFMIFGPYGAAGASYFDVLHNQMAHIGKLLRVARKRQANYVAVTQSAHERDFRSVRRAAGGSVLAAGSCATSNTYYLDHRGDSPGAPRPGSLIGFWLRSRLFRTSNYRFESRNAEQVELRQQTGARVVIKATSSPLIRPDRSTSM